MREAMESRTFGPTGVTVPVIGQGTWKIRDPASAQEAIARGHDLGMTHIDTAELYTGSEEVLRPVLEDRRDEVFLVSKVLPSHASYEGTLASCRASLDRLGTDHLDVYLLHWWHERRAPEECMRAMGTLIDEGRIRWAGVSNFSVQMMEQAMEALSPHEMACNQVMYHLWERSIEADLVPYCRDKGIAVVGYTPFGPRFPRPDEPEGRLLQEIGDKHGKTPRQVALRFLTREEPLFAIPKAEQVAHVEENAGGAGWRLDDEDLERIDLAFALPEGPRSLPTR